MTEPRTNADSALEDLFSNDDLVQIVSDFITKGYTVSELKSITTDELEAIYQVAYDRYGGGDYQTAEKMFNALCFLDHLEHKYWFGLGGSRQMLKEYESAIEAYTMAMMLDPNNPQLPFSMAECYLGLGDRERAINGFVAALEWSEDQPEPFSELRERALALLDILRQSDQQAVHEG